MPINHSLSAPAITMSNRILEAAFCLTGRLENIETKFTEETLDRASRKFPNGIGLKQAILIAAEHAGLPNPDASTELTTHVHNYALVPGMPRLEASGFSSLSLPTVLSNVANKFLSEGFYTAEKSILDIAVVKPVSDLKEITTVSLLSDSMFEQLGPSGEIKHGGLGEELYPNKADTYARILSVSRTDILNDDVSALTQAPRKLGRGAMQRLNHLGWSKFLDNATFFTEARGNLVVGGTGKPADMSDAGIDLATTTFTKQTDPDGNQLGVEPAILVVPRGLEGAARRWMNSEHVQSGTPGIVGDKNTWSSRYRVVSSSYIDNPQFPGNSSESWYLIADPRTLPVLEIVALGGKIEPNIETAEASFNVLGVQFRGFSDVGVSLQEYRGGVKMDGTPAA